MTATAIGKPKNRGPQANGLTTGQLPRFFELYALVGTLAVVAGFFALLGFNLVGWLVVSAIVYLVAVSVFSSIVENRRKATDRVVRGLVVVAFLLAFIPLVSTLWEVVARGLPAISLDFLTKSSGTVFDPNTLKVTVTYGALQSVVGTLIITGIAAVISIPIGIMTAIYLVEYAQPSHWMARQPKRRAASMLAATSSIKTTSLGATLASRVAAEKYALSGLRAPSAAECSMPSMRSRRASVSIR